MKPIYAAFLSYSHAADGKLAPAIQSALHRFAKAWYQRRAIKVFRDTTSLSAEPALWPSIEKALGDSAYFLLLASPQAARSRWVVREIEWWLRRRSVDRLLILLTQGDLVWDPAAGDFDWSRTTAIPDVLRGHLREEPLYVDLRWADAPEKLSLRHTQFRSSILDIAATLRGVPKDELDGDDVRQHRRTRTLAIAMVAAILVFAIVAAWQAYTATVQRGIATAQRNAALSRLLAAQSLRSATGPLSTLDVALLMGVTAYRVEPTAEARRSLVTSLIAANRVKRFVYTTDTLVSLTLSPDGQTLATGHTGGKVVLWDATTLRPLVTLTDHKGFVRALAFSPDGGRLAAADSETLLLWIVSNGRATIGRTMSAIGRFTSVAWSPDGTTLYANDDKTRRWDVASGQEHTAFAAGDSGSLRRLAVSSDGGTIATAGDDPAITLRDAAGRVRSTLRSPSRTVTALAFSPDGSRLASGGADGAITLWDVPSGSMRTRLERYTAPVDAVAFSPDGRTLASGSRDRLVILWDTATGAVREALRGHTNSLMHLVFRGNDELVSIGFEQTFIAWNLGVPRQSHLMAGHAGAVGDLEVSPDGATLASASDDGTIRLWDLARGREQMVLMGHEGEVRAIAFNPVSGLLASGGEDRKVRLWDPKSGRVVEEIDAEGEIESLAISADGSALAWSASGNRPIFVWDIAARARRELAGHDTAADSLEFSRTGDVLVSAGDDTIKVWDPRSGRELDPPMEAGTVVKVAVSPDGRTIASSQTFPNSVLLWRRQTNEDPIELPTRNQSSDHSPAFSPDGRLLAYSADEAALSVVLTLIANTSVGWTLEMSSSVTSITFTRDSKRLVTGHSNGRVGLWDVDVERWPEYACEIANRNLTRSEWTELVGEELPYQPACPELPLPMN